MSKCPIGQSFSDAVPLQCCVAVDPAWFTRRGTIEAIAQKLWL